MLKGTGRVDSPLMYSMYNFVRANFHSVSASAWTNNTNEAQVVLKKKMIKEKKKKNVE